MLHLQPHKNKKKYNDPVVKITWDRELINLLAFGFTGHFVKILAQHLFIFKSDFNSMHDAHTRF